ncbi:fimbrial protein [Bacteroides pyogenes]|uniref:fimbrial tip adhesin FimD n=1 Tax=Bacteroides pyogenes TaxID=310300 RepID=UPI0040640FDF
MKKGIRNFHIFPFALLLCLFIACSNENDIPENPVLPEGAKGIVVNLEIKKNNAPRAIPTRAPKYEDGNKYDALNEDKIESLKVFFFHEDGTIHSQPQKTFREGLKLTIVVPYEKINEYENKKLNIVVVANYDTSVSLDGIRSLDELKAKIQTTSDLNPHPEKAQEKFLMDGMVSSETIKWAANTIIYAVPETLGLYRAAAKIRLRIQEVAVKNTENGSTVEYQMVGQPEVKLVHYTETSSLIKGIPYPVKPEEWKITEYRKMNWKKYDGYINPTKTGEEQNLFLAASHPFYAYENDWNKEDKGEDETYMIVMIKFKAGSGEAKPYYYRIPVNYRFPTGEMTEEQKAGLRKIERNHLYDIVSSVKVLGSEDEGEPVNLEANIAIQPWKDSDLIDGDIKNAHFLVVKEHHPLMPNIADREVVYYSDLPVTVKIDKTEYRYYDKSGNLIEVIDYGSTGTNFDGTTVEANEESPLRKYLKVHHKIPHNYVPFQIYFTVTQVMPENEQGTPLSVQVHVTQYPPKYVTGQKSPGFKPNEGEAGRPYADFRFQDPLGAIALNPISGKEEPQTNDVFYKITTIVNEGDEVIGDPTDSDGRTKKDAISNRIVSPEFILASQHGMSIPIQQYSGESTYPRFSTFGPGYGPLSLKRFPEKDPYYPPSTNYDNINSQQPVYKAYKDAGDRCYNYFEGEYGMDGVYEENYVYSYYGQQYWTTRSVNKTFKYKGRWRMPTAAELKYIDYIQDAPTSSVKSILWGKDYWSAETGKAYNLTGNVYTNNVTVAPVRCVFDTYKLTNKDE